MKTKQEIEDKIKFLEEHFKQCIIETNKEEIQIMISELKWTLDEKES